MPLSSGAQHSWLGVRETDHRYGCLLPSLHHQLYCAGVRETVGRTATTANVETFQRGVGWGDAALVPSYH